MDSLLYRARNGLVDLDGFFFMYTYSRPQIFKIVRSGPQLWF